MAHLPSSLHTWVTQRVQRHPQAIALLAPDRSPLTYQQLLETLEATRTALHRVGIGRNDPVAIVLPNGPEMALAFLAVSSVATSAPLNPAYQVRECEFYLQDLQAKAIILLAGQPSPARSVARSRGLPILELVPLLEAGAGSFALMAPQNQQSLDSSMPPEWGQSEDIALVLHTSGTTSRPKQVPLTQTNLLASAHHIAQTLHLRECDRCLNIMPLFHIHGLVGALLSSLEAGGSIVCTPGFNASSFWDWLDTFQPTWYSAVPTMHQAILAQASAHSQTIASHSLRLIRSSSAALPSSVMDALEHCFQVPVIEAYGMTEASHQMASNPLPPQVRKPGSVGLAAGPEVAIMDGTGRLLPQGEIGEVVIRGNTVTAGYAHNPEANAQAFSQGWFRTGDQGYFDAEGYLFLQGRLKEMINRGGEKISPVEIDALLMELPEIHQAVAFGVPHPTLGEDLAVAIVFKPNQHLSEAKIRDFLAAHVAEFKIPSQVLMVDEIPKGSTGKLQRIGLGDRLFKKSDTELNFKPSIQPIQGADEIEVMITQIWKEVLNLENVAITDNFFALGGDSIRASQVVTRLSKAFDLALSPVLVFRRPTIAELTMDIRLSKSVSYSASHAASHAPSNYDEILEILTE